MRLCDLFGDFFFFFYSLGSRHMHTHTLYVFHIVKSTIFWNYYANTFNFINFPLSQSEYVKLLIYNHFSKKNNKTHSNSIMCEWCCHLVKEVWSTEWWSVSFDWTDEEWRPSVRPGAVWDSCDTGFSGLREEVCCYSTFGHRNLAEPHHAWIKSKGQEKAKRQK